MRIAAFDTIEPAGAITSLPARLVQTSSTTTRAFQLALGAALLSAMAVPFAMIATVAVQHPSAADIVRAHPGACLQIALGLGLWTALFALPLRRILASLNARRIEIQTDAIDVTETGLLRTRNWREPIAAYRGVAHHIRASVSGTRHELFLVHPDRARSVLLAFADRITQGEIDRTCCLLGVGEIPARELYPSVSALAPQPGISGALRPA